MTLLLWGAGAHGRVVHDLASACGFSKFVFVDEQSAGNYVRNCPVLSPDDPRVEECRQFIVAVGDNTARARCFDLARLRGLEAAVLIHPSAVVSPTAAIGRGTIVMPLVTVGVDVSIGSNCILNSGCVVEHDSRIGDHVHVSPRAVLGGGVVLESFSQAGIGSTVLPRVQVGAGSLLGAGAVAIRDVAPGWIVKGTPARPLRENTPR